jgi:hypothetical protein
MTIPTVHGWDATHENLPNAPKVGQAGGYVTGSANIEWTTVDRAAHPGFVQIDQSPAITAADVTADFYDLENGAVTFAEIAQLVKAGQAAFTAGTRPGQRWPGVYCSRSNVTETVNALVNGGVLSCPLGVAEFDDNLQKAIAEVSTAGGPFPIVWRQYSDQGGGGTFDLDVFSVSWLNNVSRKDPPVATPPPIHQSGTVTSDQTHGTAKVISRDGGHTWLYAADWPEVKTP